MLLNKIISLNIFSSFEGSTHDGVSMVAGDSSVIVLERYAY